MQREGSGRASCGRQESHPREQGMEGVFFSSLCALSSVYIHFFNRYCGLTCAVTFLKLIQFRITKVKRMNLIFF